MKKIISMFLSIVMLLTVVSGLNITAYADDNGTCGENLTYTFVEDTGLLTISGTGTMTDFNDLSDIPWNSYTDDILAIVVDEGVTSIGKLAFMGLDNLNSVTLPSTLTSIGIVAFDGCDGLTKTTFNGDVEDWCNINFSIQESNPVYYSKNLYIKSIELKALVVNESTKISAYAFYNCDSIITAIIGKSVLTIEDGAFYGCSNLSTITINGRKCIVSTADSLPIGATIRGYSDSTAEAFATDNSRSFSEITCQHILKRYDVKKAATCKDTGIQDVYCQTCDLLLEENAVVPRTDDHTPVVDSAVPATCTSTGLTEGSHCSVCGTIIKAQEVVPKSVHTIVIDKPALPTCTKTGLTVGSHCSVCNEVLIAQKPINALGHTPVIDKGIAPTNSKGGVTDGSHCSVCGEILVAQKKVAKLSTFKVSLSSVKSKKSKQITAKWKKNNKVTGYQIQYSTSSKFKSGNKSVNVNKKSTTSGTIKKLKAKKKYYVRVRGYKTVNGKKYYSSWSKTKTVKTK